MLTVTETSLVILGLLLAVRLNAGTGLNANIYLLYENGITRILLVAATFFVLSYYFDLYDSFIFGNHREVVTRFVGALGCGFLVLGFAYYLFPQLSLDGRVLWQGTAFVAIGVVIGRSCFVALNRSEQLAEHILLLGDGALAPPLFTEISRRPELGMRVVAVAGGTLGLRAIAQIDLDELTDDYLHANRIRRIVVAMDDRRGKLPVAQLLRFKARGIQIADAADYYESITGKVPVQSLKLSWLLFSPGFHVSFALRVYKRLLSILLGGFTLLFVGPVMLIVAGLIRLDSPGPILFRQKRVGEYGHTFTIYKFRSMYQGGSRNDAETPGDCSKIGRPPEQNDPRITRVGRWIRRWHLDELPQLFNIIKGDMAFVGPRPVPPEEEEQCAAQIPFYKQRWLVKPGATGWAQVNRGYNSTLDDHREKLAYDLYYIKNISAALDAYTLLATLKLVLRAKNGA